MRKTHRSRWRVFICYFFPFILIAVCVGIFDIFTSGWFLFEHFYSYNVDGLMRVLEISNVDQIRPILLRIDFSTRILPSLIILVTTSKLIVLLVFHFHMIFSLPSAAWTICTVNQHYLLHDDEVQQHSVESRRSSTNPQTVSVGHESHFWHFHTQKIKFSLSFFFAYFSYLISTCRSPRI